MVFCYIKDNHMKKPLRDMDARQIKASSQEKQAEFKDTTALGEKFEMDKAKIEQRIKEIQESHLAYEDKQDMIVGLEAELERLREQYDSDVDKKNTELTQYFENEIKIVQEKIELLKETLFSIKEMKIEAVDFDKEKASDPIREKRSEFEAIQSESKEILKSIIKTMEQQKRSIRKNNYK